MTDEIKKNDKPTAQVFRLVAPNSGGLTKLNKRNDDVPDHVKKDLGPTGGNNKNGDAIQPNAFEAEDEYQQLYVGATRDQGVIQPPYNLRQLDFLSQQNNTLGSCIEAMVTNVDGTGYEFAAEEEEEDDAADDTKLDALREFFDQPWPGTSFREIRELMRRDLERTGNAYLEILRNAQDEIVMARRVDSKMMRMLRLDDAFPVDESLVRGGKKVTVTTMKRERRYCQLVNGVTLMYFKEFGSSRDLHKKTAVWSPIGEKLPAKQRASEILHFIVILDAHTPYGVPRWIPQTPSVLGSRKAEEFNLEFFDNGGVPPVMIVLQGGTLNPETRSAIEQMNAGPSKKNNRMQVLEVQPNGGSLAATPQAKVTVERFGADRQKDGMFETYDEKCMQRILRAFRFSPIFIGDTKDFNFATAFASYTVGEAQVFKPERDKFDTTISMKLLPAMGYDGYLLKSHALNIDDPTLKLQGLEVMQAMGDQVEPADLVKQINKIVGTDIKVSATAPTLGQKMQQQAQLQQQQVMLGHQQAMAGAQAGAQGQQGPVRAINPMPKSPTGLPTPGSVSPMGGSPSGRIRPKMLPGVMGGQGKPMQIGGGMQKSDQLQAPATIPDLALRSMKALRKRDMGELAFMLPIISSLPDDARGEFDAFAAELAFIDTSYDPAGLAELATCTIDVMGHQH